MIKDCDNHLVPANKQIGGLQIGSIFKIEPILGITPLSNL
jgi:hypothetical protein